MAKARGSIIVVVIVAGLAFGGYHYFFGKEKKAASNHNKPLALQPSNDAFTQSLNAVVENYVFMKDAFVQGDTTQIAAHGNAFAQKLDSIAWSQLKADSNLLVLAQSLQAEIKAAAGTITTAPEMQARRRAFQTCSDLLFDLLRTVQYKGLKLYQQYCPMAFDNTGANWLSADTEILNPYFGSKMLHCGELRDSIAFAQ